MLPAPDEVSLLRARPAGRALFALLAATLIAPILMVPAAVAQEKPAKDRLTVDHYLDWERASDPQISPDSKQIIYTRHWVDRMEDRWDSALWIMDADGSRERFLCEGSEARWSPDGSRIAYLASEPGGKDGDTSQIFVRFMDSSNAATQITRGSESPDALRWAPDGKSIAFIMATPRKEDWTINLPAAPKGARWTDAPRVIQSMHYRADRRGFLKEAYDHIYVVTAAGGTPRQMTEGNWNVGGRTAGIPEGAGLDWTPDGQAIVFDGLMSEDADTRYLESNIYAVNVKTRAVRTITATRGPWTRPVVSHDGKTIAFVGYEWTPQTYHAEDLYVIGRDGAGMRRISGNLDRDAADLRWAPDDSGVFFTAEDDGSDNVLFAPLKGGLRRITEGKQMLSLVSVSDDGVAAGIRSTSREPGDVVRYRLRPGQPIDRLTRVNDDVLEGMKTGEVEEVRFASPDGTRIQGWLVKPPDFDPSRKYPLILHIHGGPHAMYNLTFNYSFQNLAANGYLVLYTNPRGSTGYGTAFGNAIDDAYPSVDYDDLMAGVDAVIARGWVDTTRMYVTGVSGGGVLSSWIIGHNDRFAAAAVRAPVIDWISFAGTTDVTAWGYYRFHEPFWKNPAPWLSHSPLMHVANVKTPTLLMTGELDLRTPMGQSEEFYQALKTLKVPTALVRFNGEYHGTGSKPSNFMRTQLYLLSWFGKYPATP